MKKTLSILAINLFLASLALTIGVIINNPDENMVKAHIKPDPTETRPAVEEPDGYRWCANTSQIACSTGNK